MKFIVLGGTRFIGRAIVEELAGAGHQLLLTHRGQLEPDGLPEAQHLHADRMELGKHKDELAAFKPDGAIDCRAIGRFDTEPVVAALPDGIRLVVISSVDVYQAFASLNAQRETDPVPIDEESALRSERYPYRGQLPGMDDYDKLDVEDIYLARGGTSLRLPMVYGERDYQRREEFILRRVRAGRKQIPVGAGTWLACRGYVRDLARGARLALESRAVDGQALNLCEDKTHSIGMWARMILEAAGSDAELVRVPDEALPEDLKPTGTMPQHISASANKARRLLGWTTSDPMQTLRTTVRWHLDNPPKESDADFSADDKALAAAVTPEPSATA